MRKNQHKIIEKTKDDASHCLKKGKGKNMTIGNENVQMR